MKISIEIRFMGFVKCSGHKAVVILSIAKEINALLPYFFIAACSIFFCATAFRMSNDETMFVALGS